MKILLVCLSVGLLLPCGLVAQCPEQWVQQISALPNGNLGSNYPSMEIANDGSVIVANGMINTDTIEAGGQSFSDPTAQGGNTDLFLAKYSPSGGLLWLKTINGQGLTVSLDLAIDTEDNIYLSGYFTQAMTIDGVVYSKTGTLSSYFIIKFNQSGQLQWFHKSDSASSVGSQIEWTGSSLTFAIAYNGSVEVDGQIFTADQQAVALNQDVLVGALDADGNIVHSVNVGGNGNIDVRGLECNSEGCLLQGKFDLELQCIDSTLTTPSTDHYSLYQLFLEHEGDPIWASASTNAPDFTILPLGLGLTEDGHAVFAAHFWNAGLSYGDITLSAPQNLDILVGKVNLADGDVVWLKQMQGNQNDYVNEIDVLGNSAYLGGGSASELFSFEGYEQANTGGTDDGFIISLDEDGKSRCGIGFAGSGQDLVRQVEVSNDGNVFALLSFNGQLEIEGTTYVAQGASDFLVVKTCLPCDTITSILTPLREIVLLQNDPNPFADYTDIRYQHDECLTCEIIISDISGKIIKRIKTTGSKGTVRIYSSEIGAGMFIYSLVMDGQLLRTEKMVSTKH
jgi:hypothetical protein